MQYQSETDGRTDGCANTISHSAFTACKIIYSGCFGVPGSVRKIVNVDSASFNLRKVNQATYFKTWYILRNIHTHISKDIIKTGSVAWHLSAAIKYLNGSTRILHLHCLHQISSCLH